MVFQPEEDPAVPARAGDGAGNSGQRLVGAPLPFEATLGHGDDLFDALPFAQQPGAGDRAVAISADAALLLVAAVQFFAQPLKPPDRLRLQPARGRAGTSCA
jgi:hypothetical protein